MFEVTDTPARPRFAIVGVGASAGGLHAFSQLLRHLPATTDLAFVLIQHLDPTHPSLLAEALSKMTMLPVQQAEQGMRLEQGHVYVIAPNTDLAISEGLLLLSPRQSDHQKTHMPVDFFLRSLATERGSHAIGVVLSGNAFDGTEGLRAIRVEGGITFVQTPRTAKFPGMPQNAIDAGVVDQCLDIPELADELVRLSSHPYVRAQVVDEPETRDIDVSTRNEILARVQEATGTDFSEFKPATVTRRLARRVALRGVADLAAYLALLDVEPDELHALQEDVLIHVTAFFRDPDVFEALRAQVFPEILKHKAEDATIRVWVAGCSTGEEVYSLAIALLEFLGKSGVTRPIQIFGSDVSEIAIQKARAGVYAESALRGVSEERRTRYFSQHEFGLRVHKHVRELCVFVRHDLARDPPFSKLDLLSCRNVLIYFDQALQKRVLPILHYCLNQPGYLVLGRSESIPAFSRLFSDIDKTHKIFLRTATVSNLRFAPRSTADAQTSPMPPHGRGALFQDYSALLAKHLDRMLLARYCPAGVLVKENMDVLLFRGQTGSYLQAAPGQPQNNLIGMARGGLIAALRETIDQAKQDLVVVRRSDVVVEQGGATKRCDVVVLPFSGLPENVESLFVVLFEEPLSRVEDPPELGPALHADPNATAALARSARLEHELTATKEYLHLLIEDHGRTNDELGTSNEELVSGNEELQSMNEELETAKEELQSTNEELTTLNDELQRRNQEVTRVNTDLLNFSLTVDIPILRLDMERRIQRFTPNARGVLNISPLDVGRSIDDIRLNVAVPNLSQQITSVIESGEVKEFEVQDLNGHWYRMQIRPYTTIEHVVEGALVSLVDIDELKRLVGEAERARAQAEHANTAKDDFLATLSHELRTPLSSMLLNAQGLREGDMDHASLLRAADSLERAIGLQVKLIDDLLDISRIVTGKLRLDSRALDLCELVQASLDNMAPLFEAKQLAVKGTLGAGLPPIWADPARVEQVISNLLGNAIKFTPRVGQVTVVVDAADGGVRLRITDTGIGIDPSFLPRVFAHFSQHDSSITRSYGGLGLGLALVRQLVELQGGTVLAQSPGLGHGATFSVTFPVARASDTPALALTVASRRVGANALDRPGRAKRYDALMDVRLLFIDDDFRTREAVLEVLQFTGARVALAASAADGVMALDTFKPHIIVCDIAMPGEDGYAFIRKLRAREAGRSAPIPALALTALTSADDRQRALAAGYQLHLAKPIDIDRLRDAMLELVKLSAQPSA